MSSRPSRPSGRLDDGGLQALLVIGAVALALMAGIVGWAIGRETAPGETTTVNAGGAGAGEAPLDKSRGLNKVFPHATPTGA